MAQWLSTAIAAYSALLLFSPTGATAQEYATEQADTEVILAPDAFSPYAGRNFPLQPLWGDSHLHTMVSVDAGTMTRLSQEDAFRFARGEEVTTTHGLRAKLSRPLDWLVIADHAEMYGLMPQLLSGDPEILATARGKAWYEALTAGDAQLAFDTAMEIVATLAADEPPIDNPKAVKRAWENYTALADRYNDPGVFSAIIGYEFTTEGANNLHRNVLFRNGAILANQTRPFSLYDSKNPEDLWTFLAEYEERTGGEVLAIAHNGNLSNGRMFSFDAYDGSALPRRSPRCARASSRSTRPPRSRGMARRTRSSVRRTSSPISTHGTRPTSTAPCRRSRGCWRPSMRARV